jgi:hypothetical protein
VPQDFAAPAANIQDFHPRRDFRQFKSRIEPPGQVFTLAGGELVITLTGG